MAVRKFWRIIKLDYYPEYARETTRQTFSRVQLKAVVELKNEV